MFYGILNMKFYWLSNYIKLIKGAYIMFERIREIIVEQLGLDDVEGIERSTTLLGDLEADSLDAVEIIMAIEDEFGVEIPDEEVENFKNIGDIVDFVESHK